ncbi:MAG: alpha/beta hydrolase-fold protein [Bacteroidia bacterium]
MNRLALAICFLLFGVVLLGQGSKDSIRRVEILNSETFTLYSDGLETEYHIKVLLPESYAKSDKKYPVLYLLDGDHAFAMATDIVTYMQYGGHIPEMIIVSPAYNDKNGPDEGGNNQRRRDFSPFRWDGVPSNPSADKYYAFLNDTIIAHIDNKYRTKENDRTLWGYSRSGLFVLWTLFERPGTFDKYIALDTGFHKFNELESNYHAQHDTLNARLFIGYGSLGNSKKDIEFMEQLSKRNYKKFKYEFKALQGEKHLMIPSTGLALGLEFVNK